MSHSQKTIKLQSSVKKKSRRKQEKKTGCQSKTERTETELSF